MHLKKEKIETFDDRMLILLVSITKEKSRWTETYKTLQSKQ